MNSKNNRKSTLEEGQEAFLSPDDEHRTIGAFSRIAHDCTAPGGCHRRSMHSGFSGDCPNGSALG